MSWTTWRTTASTPMTRRAPSCGPCARTRSRPRSCPPAPTAPPCSRRPGWRRSLTRGWMGRDLTPPRAPWHAGARCVAGGGAAPPGGPGADGGRGGRDRGRRGRTGRPLRLHHWGRWRWAGAGAPGGRRRCGGDQPGAGPGGRGAPVGVVPGVRRVRPGPGGHP